MSPSDLVKFSSCNVTGVGEAFIPNVVYVRKGFEAGEEDENAGEPVPVESVVRLLMEARESQTRFSDMKGLFTRKLGNW